MSAPAEVVTPPPPIVEDLSGRRQQRRNDADITGRFFGLGHHRIYFAQCLVVSGDRCKLVAAPGTGY